MATSEERERHAKRRKKNIFAKILTDRFYSQRIVEPKNKYKRERIDLRKFIEKEEE